MTDWAQSGRIDRYRFFAVDPFTLQEKGELQAEPSACTITWGYYTDNKVCADLVLVNDSYIRDGRDAMIRVKHIVELPDGTQAEETLGTFFVDKAERVERDGIVRQKLTCYSSMWRLSQDFLPSDFVAPVGNNCAQKIGQLISEVGGTMLTGAGVDTTRTNWGNCRWRCGVNRLETINEYAGFLNWVVDVDDYGRQILNQYISPSKRAVAYEFENGANCVYLPELDETYTGEVYNRVIVCWSRESTPSTPDGFGLCDKYVTELQETNEYSFARCGRYMTKVLDLAEPASQADMKAKGDAFLEEHDAAIRYLTIQHVGIPDLRVGQVVRFNRGGEPSNLCEITQMEIRGLKPLAITETKLKVIE